MIQLVDKPKTNQVLDSNIDNLKAARLALFSKRISTYLDIYTQPGYEPDVTNINLITQLIESFQKQNGELSEVQKQKYIKLQLSLEEPEKKSKFAQQLSKTITNNLKNIPENLTVTDVKYIDKLILQLEALGGNLTTSQKIKYDELIASLETVQNSDIQAAA